MVKGGMRGRTQMTRSLLALPVFLSLAAAYPSVLKAEEDSHLAPDDWESELSPWNRIELSGEILLESYALEDRLATGTIHRSHEGIDGKLTIALQAQISNRISADLLLEVEKQEDFHTHLDEAYATVENGSNLFSFGRQEKFNVSRVVLSFLGAA